jgi:hypothetical protein
VFGASAIRYRPSGPAIVVATDNPATLASIVAPGSTAPDVSFTVPVMSTLCAAAAVAKPKLRTKTKLRTEN